MKARDIKPVEFKGTILHPNGRQSDIVIEGRKRKIDPTPEADDLDGPWRAEDDNLRTRTACRTATEDIDAANKAIMTDQEPKVLNTTTYTVPDWLPYALAKRHASEKTLGICPPPHTPTQKR